MGGVRRRVLLSVEQQTTNQMKHFVNNIGVIGESIKHEPETNNQPKQNPKPEPEPEIPNNNQLPVDKNPSSWYLSLSSPYVYFIGSILGIVLFCNVVFIIYVKCFKGERVTQILNATRRSGYKSVKPTDSEY